MKKFLYFTKLTHIINKKKIPFPFPNSTNLGPFQKFRTNFSSPNLVLLPISFFPEMDLEKKIFESKKNQLFTKQRVSPKNNQFIHLSSQKQQLLKIERSILCTVSGGQDSIFTFFLLLHTKKIDSLKIIYCHHFWQIKNFFSARLIFQISYLVDVPYTLILPQKLVESENESRNWRKKNFCRFSQLEHILTIITGHTETDNLEKNLNNLFRGTSPAGLASLNLLNASNRVGLFFSTIKFTSYFLSKREKRRTFYQKFLFQNLKNNNRICSLSFPDFEKSDSLLRDVNLNSFQNLQDLDPTSKRFKSFRFFDGTKLFQKNKTNEMSSSPLSQTDQFWDHCQLLPNFEKERDHLGPHRKSSSFCFSNKFLKLQVNLFKPLENISRSSVSKFFNLYNVPLMLDVTNFSYIFSRNKIRHQVLPFIRSLINLNVEKLIINFFTMLSQQNKEIGKDIQELEFISKILTLYFVKSTEFVFYPNLTNSITATSRLNLIRKLLKEKKLANGYGRTRDGFKPKELKNNLSASFGTPNRLPNLESKTNLVKVDEWVNSYSLKIKPNSEIQVRSLLQKFFFDYKNVNLSYSQILKLQDFYSLKNKKMFN